jgi:hypothetical protein
VPNRRRIAQDAAIRVLRIIPLLGSHNLVTGRSAKLHGAVLASCFGSTDHNDAVNQLLNHPNQMSLTRGERSCCFNSIPQAEY